MGGIVKGRDGTRPGQPDEIGPDQQQELVTDRLRAGLDAHFHGASLLSGVGTRADLQADDWCVRHACQW